MENERNAALHGSKCLRPTILIALLVLCLCSCGSGKITVKSELADGETISKVELSDGELFFKNREDVLSELTPQDFEDAKPKASEYHRNEPHYPVFTIEGTEPINEEEAKKLLNIYPEKWAIPERCGSDIYQHNFIAPSYCRLENGEYDYAESDLFWYEFRNGSGVYEPQIKLFISPAPLKWSQLSDKEDVFPIFISLKLTYGDLNSQIGDMPLAITYEERNSPEQERYMVYRAYFEAGNAAYEVLAQGVTQREFIDVLISIYASPRPETRSFFSCVLPGGTHEESAS